MNQTSGMASQGSRSAGSADPPVLTGVEITADPHGVFRFYRERFPFVWHEKGDLIVLRHADIEMLARDPRLRATEVAFPALHGVTDGPLFDLFDQGMLTANGETHRRRRAPFTRAFASRMIADLRPAIRQTAEHLIDLWYDEGEVDFLAQFASPLPATVLATLLGLPAADIPVFTHLVYEVTRFFSLSIRPEEIPEVEPAARELQDYVERTLADRRRSPRDDFLSNFLVAADTAGEMSPSEIIFQVVQLIIGGTDTTRVAMAMQVALLLQHPDQWRAVCEDQDLVPAAVAESMRFEPSVAGNGRITLAEVELGGGTLPAGKMIGLSAMSAMRDERIYEDPDVFDIRRTGQPRLHPIFGWGVHRCIGEALAKAELEETLGVLTRRIPQLQLQQPPPIVGYSGIRRIEGAMRVSWKA